MSTTATLYSSNQVWGSSSFNSSTDQKVGKTGSTSSDGTKYRGRMTFEAQPRNVIITSIKLYMRRIDSYSTHTLAVGSSTSSAWGASLDFTRNISVSSGTGSKNWDLTAYASEMQSYSGSWYMHVRHGSGTNSYTEFDTSGSDRPRLVVEYQMPNSAPSVSSSSVALGTAVTIYTNREDTSYLHTVNYSFGGTSGTIATNVGDSVNWTPPLSLASQIPSATSGSCTITCHTYYSGVLTGTKSCTLTLSVPSTVVPAVAGVSISEAVSGQAAQFGVYVQNKSKVSVSISAAGSYGSAISTYRATLAGVTYSTSSFTSGVLTAAGSNALSITVTDSRGRSATANYSVNVTAYTSPSITTFLAARCNSAGTAAQIDGTRMWYTLAASASPVNSRNTMSCVVQYKLKSASTWTTATTVTHSNYAVSHTNVALPVSIVFNALNSYDLQVTITDYFGSVTAAAGLNTKQVVFDIKADGTGMGIGKVAETSNTLDVGWALKLASPLPVASGGTGQTTLQAVRSAMGLGNTTGALPVENGGTGQTSLALARNAMGLGNTTGAQPPANGGTGQTSQALARNAMGLGNTTGALPVANGGTGASDAASARYNLGLNSAGDIRAGVIQNVTVNKSGVNSFSVTFSPSRSSVPTAVLATGYGSAAAVVQYWSFSSGNFSTTGCTIYATRTSQESGTGTISLQWIAI